LLLLPLHLAHGTWAAGARDAVPARAAGTTAIGSVVSDVSSKGLLPQLTDVLHALTESQELLFLKLQSVRRQNMSVVPLVIEELPPPAQFIELHNPRPAVLVDTKTGTTKDAYQVPPTEQVDEVESRSERGWLASSEPDRHSSEPDTHSSIAAASGLITHSVTPAPLPTRREVVTVDRPKGAALAAGESAPPDLPQTVDADLAGAESTNHDYNFFDDLDATLASLKNPDSGTGER
jgi:hypothetical protein